MMINIHGFNVEYVIKDGMKKEIIYELKKRIFKQTKWFLFISNWLAKKIKRNQIYICYTIAKPSVWSEIFNIKNMDDIKIYKVGININWIN